MESDSFLFVSHVSEDRVAAMSIVGELERRGVPCWIAPRNIGPGKPFDDEIASALEQCRAMLLIFSDQCNESEYIRREVTVAGENQKVIIPFRIEDAQPRRGLRVRLSDLHWLDGVAHQEGAIDELTRWFAPSSHAAQNERTVIGPRPLAGRTASQPAADATTRPPMPPPSQPAAAVPAARSSLPLIASVGVVALLAAAGAVWFWSGGFGARQTTPVAVATPAPVKAPLATPDTPSPPKPAPALPDTRVEIKPPPAAPDALANGKAAFDRKDYGEAMRWNRQAADEGNAVGQTYVGYLYENGLGAPQNYAKALIWYRKAADQGRAAAQKNMGNLYEQGWGVTRDYAEALRWYRKAADQGHPAAQTSVGYLYEKGLGVSQDYAEAIRWYRMAANQGEPTAQNNIGVFYDKGYGVAQDYAEALRWYRRAADQGNIDAEFNLALLYADGHGVTRNLDEARQWMQKAADAGDPEARKWLTGHGG